MYINNIHINENERVDDLHRKGYKLIQNPNNFCFGCDAVLLSSFVKVKKNEIVLDLGTGTGIIPILLEAKTCGKLFIGLEIQEDSVEMARRSVALNNLSGKIQIHHGNIKELTGLYPLSHFDVVTTNPPYIVTGGGLINEASNKAVARHEILCNLKDIIEGSAKILKPGGRFYMIHRPDRLIEITTALHENKLEPKTIQFIHPRLNKPPTMFLVEAVRGGNSMVKVLSPLIMYNGDGTYTSEINEIYYRE